MLLLITDSYCNTHETIEICHTVILSPKGALFWSSQVQRPAERNCNLHTHTGTV